MRSKRVNGLRRQGQRTAAVKTVQRAKPAKKTAAKRVRASVAPANGGAGPAANGPRRRAFEPVALVLVGLCVVAAVAVMAVPRQPWDRRAVEQAVKMAQDGRPEAIEEFVTAATHAANTASQTSTSPRVAPAEPVRPESAAAAVIDGTRSSPIATLQPAPDTAALAAGAADVPAISMKAVALPLSSQPMSPVSASAAVTIAGCLERDDDTFFLKDVSGAEVPKARSWKSGFLSKRSARVEVIDEGHALRLASHVGQRIETTGALVDREMRPRSLVVRGACE